MGKSREPELPFAEGRPRPKPEYEPFVPGSNPNLAEFIQQHSTPCDPARDKYDVKAFNRDIFADKAAPVHPHPYPPRGRGRTADMHPRPRRVSAGAQLDWQFPEGGLQGTQDYNLSPGRSG